MSETLVKLDAILAQRKAEADSSSSYVAQLHQKGLNKILEKLGEEAIETIISAKDAAKIIDSDGKSKNISKSENKAMANTPEPDTLKHMIYETADLWFHSMVMLSHMGTNTDAVLKELERRFDLSGLEEKARRK